MKNANQSLTKEESNLILTILKTRFEKSKKRFKDVNWEIIEKKLFANKKVLWSLSEMERTGGEPDLFYFDKTKNEYVFCDFSIESPKGRRSLCYDREALNSRKEHKPESSVIDIAEFMGIQLLSESEYRELQKLGNFDLKTSSWVQTPANIRKLGGALFCDKRYDTVFLYHNGAESYYASRGFRGLVKV
jgi:hypothetical protein